MVSMTRYVYISFYVQSGLYGEGCLRTESFGEALVGVPIVGSVLFRHGGWMYSKCTFRM